MKRVVLVVVLSVVVAVFCSIDVLAEENTHAEHSGHYNADSSSDGGGSSIVGSIAG